VRSGHRITTGDAELLNMVAIVLALVVIAGLAVLFVARYFSLRRSVSIKNSGPLSEAERRELGTPHEDCFRRVYVVRGLEWSSTDRFEPGAAGARVVEPGYGGHHRGCRTSDPLLWAVPPLWLHHRFAESPLAPMELREVQDTLPLMPTLTAAKIGALRA
jgi:hypothetical protein